MGLARLRLGALHSLLRHAGSASLHKSARFSSSRKSGLRPEGSNPRGVHSSRTSDLRSGFSFRDGVEDGIRTRDPRYHKPML